MIRPELSDRNLHAGGSGQRFRSERSAGSAVLLAKCDDSEALDNVYFASGTRMPPTAAKVSVSTA